MYKESEFIKHFYKPGDVGKLLGISPRTVQDYDRRGQLVFDRSETGRRLVPRERLLSYLDSQHMLLHDEEIQRRDVIYARVSDSNSDMLDKQVVFLIEGCGTDLLNPLVFKDCGSGFDAKREKIQELIRMVMNNEVRNVYIAYRDCLACFGFEYFETMFAAHDTRIIVVNGDSFAYDDACDLECLQVQIEGLKKENKETCFC